MPIAAWGEFVALPENDSALRAARRLTRALTAPGKRPPPTPLVLHGPPGTGKSLLVATVVRKLADHPAGITAQVFPAGELRAPAPDDAERTDEFADLLTVDLLAVEDVQHLPVRSAAALCRLLDGRAARRRPTVVTAPAGPAGLTRLPRRLTTRLAAGLVVRLDAPAAESRRILLERVALKRGVRLTEDALDWLAAQARDGLRPVLGQLEVLRVLSRGTAGRLDAAALAELLAGGPIDAKSPLDRIVARVAAAFGVKPKDVVGTCRQRSALVPRQVAMYLARESAKLSLPRIGAFFGRDHSTVLHAVRKVEAAIKGDAKLKRTVRELKADLL